MHFGCCNFGMVVTSHLGACLNDDNDGLGFVGSTACCEEGLGTMGNCSSWSIIWRTCSSCHHSLWCDENTDDDCPSRHTSVYADDSLVHPWKWGAPWSVQGFDPSLLLDCSSRSNELCRLRACKEGNDQRWERVQRVCAGEESHGGFQRLTSRSPGYHCGARNETEAMQHKFFLAMLQRSNRTSGFLRNTCIQFQVAIFFLPPLMKICRILISVGLGMAV